MTDTAMKETAAPAAEADCGAGRRNRYFRAKHLKAEDFQAEQTYFIGRRRLINRAVIGWGVVYGFALPKPAQVPDAVKPAADGGSGTDKASRLTGTDGRPLNPTPVEGSAPVNLGGEQPAKTSDGPAPAAPAKIEPFDLTVGRGFALDEDGREIVVASTQTLSQANTFLLEASTNGWRPASLDGAKAGCYQLSVHYAERPTGLVSGAQDCGCALPQANYVCETAVFSLRPIECGKCPCGEPVCPDCGGCYKDACCSSGRGPHGRLCCWTADEPGDPDNCLQQWKGMNVAVSDGVALACLTLADTGDRCKPLSVKSIDDACGARRIVKNNDLLYDLMRGCDLTRISDYSWKDWHRSPTNVLWKDFAGKFREGGKPDGVTDFWVQFSGPVLEKSLLPDVITITVFGVDQGTGWRIGRRVPIAGFDLTPSDPNLKLPAGTTDQFRVEVRPSWVHDELDSDDESFLTQRRFIVEIDIRGDLIVDCSGQPIDGNSVGLRKVPSGDGIPGGNYLSSFTVEPKPVDPNDL